MNGPEEILLYLCVSTALLSAWAIQKCSRLQHWSVSELTRWSAMGNCEWRICLKSLWNEYYQCHDSRV